MKTKVIVNPHASGGAAGKRWPVLQRKLSRAIGAFDVALTTGPDTASTLARDALQRG